jgi:Mpv17 / PMP22 family
MHSNRQERSLWGIAAIGVMASSMIYGINECNALHLAPITSNIWTWYKNVLVSRPILTKSLTSSCIMTISDFLCQELVMSLPPPASSADGREQSSSPPLSSLPPSFASGLDYTRMLHVAITGALWSGPATHYWYAALERIYGAIAQLFNIQDPVVGLVVKLVLDGIIFSPVTITGYFTVRSILEGGGLQGARDKLTSRFKTTLVGAWRFWPLANAFNFWYVPYQFRVLYMNVVALVWTGYLTHINSKKVIVAELEIRT